MEPTDRATTVAREVREGLRAAAPYLLSHHVAAERDRCHVLHLRGRRVRVCARCAGIYPGIGLALLAGTRLGVIAPPAILALLPVPALVEWIATGSGDRRGRNDVRTLTGTSLGAGYGFGLSALLAGRNRPAVLAVGAGYAVLAGILLVRDRQASH